MAGFGVTTEGKGFRISYLRPFSPIEVDAYIDLACGSRARELKDKIHRIYNLAELSQRPLLLDMTVRSIDRLTYQEINAAELYKVFTDAWIHRDRWRDVLRPEEKLAFLMALARKLWIEEARHIHYLQLREYVGVELDVSFDDPQRLVEIEGEIRTATFLVRDDAGNYGFAHSSYSEYFLARYISDRLKCLEFESIAIRRLSGEVIDFILQMIGNLDLEPPLTEILRGPFRQNQSENALLILYRLRRNLMIHDRSLLGLAESSKVVLRVEMPEGIQLSGAKLAQVTLEGVVLWNAVIDHCDLRQSILRGSDLSGSILQSSLFEKSDLEGSILKRVDASNASFCEANLNRTNIGESVFDYVDLSGSVFAPIEHETASLLNVIARGVIVPPGFSQAFFDRLSSAEVGNNQSVQDQIVIDIYQMVRSYAAKQETPFNVSHEDVASEVVVFLLARPGQLARLFRQKSGARRKLVLALARRLMTRDVADIDIDLSKGKSSISEMPEDQRVEFDLWEHLARDRTESDLHRPASQREDDTGIEVPLDWFDFWYEPGEIEDDSAQEDRAQLLGIIEQSLSPRAYRILVRRYANGETLEEIAATEGLSELQTVRQLSRARALARSAVKGAVH